MSQVTALKTMSEMIQKQWSTQRKCCKLSEKTKP